MIDKNTRIKETLLATRNKRKNQICRVYELKIDESSLNNNVKNVLERLFVEGKWFFNYLIGLSDQEDKNTLWNIDAAKIKTVKVLNKDKKWEDRELLVLKSSQKSEIHKIIQSNIKTLSTLKKNGYKVGRIKFKSECNSIQFKQYGVTHKIVSPTKIKIQGIHSKLRVKGLKQILTQDGIEFANANLIRKSSGYYFKITTYINKDKILTQNNGLSIGIDFGIKNSFTLSDGRTFNYSIEESEHLKRLQKKLARQKKGSNNRRKTIKRINKCYEKLNNKKNDCANKFVAMIKRYNRIVIQNESLSEWKNSSTNMRAKINSKKIQHSILGRVKSKLILLKQTVVLDKWIPTTQWCRNCGSKTKTNGAIFNCTKCNLNEDRDIHAAKNMQFILDNFIPMECRDFKHVEFETSCNAKFKTMKHEDGRSLAEH